MSQPRNRCLLKPLAVFVVAIMLLSSFSIIVAVVSHDISLEEAEDVPARSAEIVEPFLPSNFTISPIKAYVGQVVTFTAIAESDVATNLTFTIYYDYLLSDGVTPNPESPVSVNVTGNPGKVVTEYIYNAPGNLSGNVYRVRLVIDDGTGDQLIKSRVVEVNENAVPYIVPAPPEEWHIPLDRETFTAYYNMSVMCYDDENENLTLTWDFGDGTDPVVQVTGPSLMGVECVQNHTWSPDPELWYGVGDTAIPYNLNLSLTDGLHHWYNWTTVILIDLVFNFCPEGNLSASPDFLLSTYSCDPTDVVTLYGKASDGEGEPLTWTFHINNSIEIIHTAVYHTGLTDPGTVVYQNMSYVFSVPGNYSVCLYLTDISNPELLLDPEYASHNATKGTVTVTSKGNSAPTVSKDILVRDVYTDSQDIAVNETTGVALVRFSIQANDVDGDKLYVNWSFGDGSEPALNETPGGSARIYTFTQIHEYSRGGEYNVTVVVTDGRPGHEVLRYKLLGITSNNSPPMVRDLYLILSNSSYGLPGLPVQFVLVVFDLERDPLEVRWDFGDGSPFEWTNVTSFDEDGNATCTINHTYMEIGMYKAWANFTDRVYGPYHEVSYSSLVVIDIRPPEEVRHWDWWDYTSLGILFLVIALLILWALMGTMKRRRIDMMGTTLEEYLLRKKEIENYEERHSDGKGQE